MIVFENGQLSQSLKEMMLDEDSLVITPARDQAIYLFVRNYAPDFSEQKIIVNFLSPGASVNIFGLYQLDQQQKLNIQTTMNHIAPHCKSEQTWRGVLSDHAKIDFEGLIDVKAGAEKAVAHLSNKNLLLSSRAEVNTKPFLIINAEDVQCTHGATVGFLDKDALFYLRSRGVAEEAARAMLIDAFTRCPWEEVV